MERSRGRIGTGWVPIGGSVIHHSLLVGLARTGLARTGLARTGLALAGLALAGLALGTGCGTTPNGQFCDETRPCPDGYDCTDSACSASPAPDASPSCPVATHQCVPNTPADWTGPMLRTELGNEEAFTACAAEAGSYVGGGSFETGGSCECSCTTAETVSCTDAKMEAVGGGSLGCGIAQCLGGCLTQEISPNVCTSMISGILGENNVRMRAGTIIGGSCIEGSLAPITPAAEFDDLVAMCPGETTEGDCGESAACAPLAPEGFAQESCIYRVGDHECPADSGFTEKTTSFARLNDVRSCGACECELPTAGTSCGGETVSCNISGVTQDSTCVSSSVWNVGATAFQYNPDPADVECVPTEVNPVLSGEVRGVDPTTICCTPSA